MKKVIRKIDEGISSFDTEDLALAAALLSKGYEMISMHPTKKRSRSLNSSFIYHFKITSSIEQAANDWSKRLLQIDEDKFIAEIMNLNYQMILWSSL
ncbi:MAG: hypothetical protein KIH63_001665 [Candidatus Saccharibacteria bacterium]|nr:hypothetical protein [Candidatus Saccharibacteria bacterium]